MKPPDPNHGLSLSVSKRIPTSVPSSAASPENVLPNLLNTTLFALNTTFFAALERPDRGLRRQSSTSHPRMGVSSARHFGQVSVQNT